MDGSDIEHKYLLCEKYAYQNTDYLHTFNLKRSSTITFQTRYIKLTEFEE